MTPSRRALVGMLLGIVVASLVSPFAVQADSPQVGDQATVRDTEGEGLRLRAAVWGRALRTLPEGTSLSVIDEDTDSSGTTWYQVQAGSTQGWVNGTYLQQISEQEEDQRSTTTRGGIRNTAADIGLQYVGYRYAWGGTSPRTGFDCSGLVYYVFQTMGISISRDYWGMMDRGTPVSRNQLQPGDLVFFVNTYKAGLSHVGIYVGDGQFVHAVDERRGVQVDSLSSSYYAARYYAARRIE